MVQSYLPFIGASKWGILSFLAYDLIIFPIPACFAYNFFLFREVEDSVSFPFVIEGFGDTQLCSGAAPYSVLMGRF